MSADDVVSQPDSAANRCSRDDDLFEYIAGGLIGILLTGALFPVLVGCFTFVIPFCFGGFPGIATHRVILALVFAFVLFCISGFISLFTGLVSLLLVSNVNRSLGSPIGKRSAAISVGSLALYLPMVSFEFYDIDEFRHLAVIATCLGAVGSSWSARRQERILGEGRVARQTKYCLTIFRLMAGTAWVAVVFAIANVTGSMFFVFAVAGWFVLTALLVGLAKLYRVFRPDPLLSRLN